MKKLCAVLVGMVALGGTCPWNLCPRIPWELRNVEHYRFSLSRPDQQVRHQPCFV